MTLASTRLQQNSPTHKLPSTRFCISSTMPTYRKSFGRRRGLFFILAATLVTSLPRNAERTVALRKLLEAKDAAVRANLPAPTFGQKSLPIEPELGEPREVGGHDEDRDGPIDFKG
jgi:hypothetical protein